MTVKPMSSLKNQLSENIKEENDNQINFPNQKFAFRKVSKIKEDKN